MRRWVKSLVFAIKRMMQFYASGICTTFATSIILQSYKSDYLHRDIYSILFLCFNFSKIEYMFFMFTSVPYFVLFNVTELKKIKINYRTLIIFLFTKASEINIQKSGQSVLTSLFLNLMSVSFYCRYYIWMDLFPLWMLFANRRAIRLDILSVKGQNQNITCMW